MTASGQSALLTWELSSPSPQSPPAQRLSLRQGGCYFYFPVTVIFSLPLGSGGAYELAVPVFELMLQMRN